MLVTNFDTHNYVKRLVIAGMPEKQAEVQADTLKNLIDNQLATKQDLNQLEANLKRDIKELEVKIETSKAEIIKWVTGLLLGQAALIATLVKFLSK